MSDLRPEGVPVELGGQERHFLFTINAIDEIQTQCNREFFETIDYAAAAANGKMDHETLVCFRSIVTVLVNDESGEHLTEKEVGRMLTLHNYCIIARKVLEAFGVSIPEPDEDKDEDDDDTKAAAGQ